MHRFREIAAFALLLFCSSFAYAQKPGPEFWRKVSCEPLEPRTMLEALEVKYTTVVLKGFESQQLRSKVFELMRLRCTSWEVMHELKAW